MHPAPELSVRVDRRAQVVVVTVRGEVDYDDVADFERAWEAADRAGMPVTAVDLAGVTFADSMLLNALVRARHRHRADGRTLVLVGPLRAAVSRLLEISGTAELFTVTDVRPGYTGTDGG
ncbi:STAS domain-containing protein [Streptomyces sp. Ag109_O5-10]|uniref:STAS domain-containing protein n=1 Tax=Streptomyces sp. Ag109_O5-10 TaxID=1855349 RepID=UPI0008959591|nr:STAS domain-containing protein [Streptomyces sp. Ag109_O5-10]SEF15572.1 anti-anti-sigma factor [Streptomyces sp. Ag109_O5-10]